MKKQKNQILSCLIVSSIFFTVKHPFASFSLNAKGSDNQKIGVLLVNHGSRSQTWRNTLVQLENNVSATILKSKEISEIKTAFMEYNEPSIATQMKEFDKNGFSDVIIVPVFLNVSPHSFEDIPTILGQKDDKKSREMMKIEKIERYFPKARLSFTPLLNFSDILQKNVLRRVKALSKNPGIEGLVLIGYGDETYDKEWIQLFKNVAGFVEKETGINEYSYGWCGHIAHYNPNETTKSINKVFEKKSVAIVIPVLVAMDEMFQIKIIGTGIKNSNSDNKKVFYKPDSILPDINIENWVIDIVKDHTRRIKNPSAK